MSEAMLFCSIAAVVAVVLLFVVISFSKRLKENQSERDQLRGERDRLLSRFRGVIDADKERTRIAEEIHTLLSQRTQESEEIQKLTDRIEATKAELAALDEEATLYSFGLYKPRYDFADSARFQMELDKIRDQQKKMVKEKAAATCVTEWTVNGSKVEGRRQINQTLKLMLRAFNGETDAAIAKVKYNNVLVMETRIKKAFEMIGSLGEAQHCHLEQPYLNLKLQELYLVHEYEEKVQDEKEEQKKIREQIHDEEIAQREFEKAKADAERDEQRYEQALAKAREEVDRAAGEKQAKLLAQIDELQRRVLEAQANKERAIARAQMTRSGHVYVISNIGAFGEHLYKVGMTRRLDPFERVRELGDASVPFAFDVHAIIYCEDAPSLENTLHREFHNRRVNRVNERKEFFKVTLDEIIVAVQKHHNVEVEFTKIAPAAEYRKTQAILDEEARRQAMIPIAGQKTTPAISIAMPLQPQPSVTANS